MFSKQKTLGAVAGVLCAGLLAAQAHAADYKKPDRLHFIGGSTGGSWYAFATGMVPIFKRNGIDVTVEPGGGSVNPLRIAKGEADAAFGQTSANFDAKQGIGAFAKYGKITGIHNIVMVSTDHVHVVCAKETGISTWEGMKGARLGAPSAATASWGNFLAGAQVMGLKESDFNVVSRGGAETGAKMVKDRQADCVTHTSHYPISSFSELAITRPINVIGMTDEQMKKVGELNEGLVPGMIPAGAYKGVEKDTKVYKAGSVMMTHEGLDPAKSYWIVKILAENLEDVRKIHAGLAPLNMETMRTPPVFKMHPGAAAYFKEKGTM